MSSVPDTAACLRLMDQYGMLDNIRHHSLVVARVADLLVCELNSGEPAGPVPDRNLVLAGALLHDIAKTPCLEKGCDHACRGAEICRRHGFPEVASIVAHHVILQDFAPDRYRNGHFSAEEIVYYADKRVRHQEIVSLDERLTYILDNYSHGDPRLRKLIRDNFDQCRELERRLFTHLPFGPERVEKRVRCPRPTPKTWDDFWS